MYILWVESKESCKYIYIHKYTFFPHIFRCNMLYGMYPSGCNTWVTGYYKLTFKFTLPGLKYFLWDSEVLELSLGLSTEAFFTMDYWAGH